MQLHYTISFLPPDYSLTRGGIHTISAHHLFQWSTPRVCEEYDYIMSLEGRPPFVASDSEEFSQQPKECTPEGKISIEEEEKKKAADPKETEGNCDTNEKNTEGNRSDEAAVCSTTGETHCDGRKKAEEENPSPHLQRENINNTKKRVTSGSKSEHPLFFSAEEMAESLPSEAVPNPIYRVHDPVQLPSWMHVTSKAGEAAASHYLQSTIQSLAQQLSLRQAGDMKPKKSFANILPQRSFHTCRKNASFMANSSVRSRSGTSYPSPLPLLDVDGEGEEDESARSPTAGLMGLPTHVKAPSLFHMRSTLLRFWLDHAPMLSSVMEKIQERSGTTAMLEAWRTEETHGVRGTGVEWTSETACAACTAPVTEEMHRAEAKHDPPEEDGTPSRAAPQPLAHTPPSASTSSSSPTGCPSTVAMGDTPIFTPSPSLPSSSSTPLKEATVSLGWAMHGACAPPSTTDWQGTRGAQAASPLDDTKPPLTVYTATDLLHVFLSSGPPLRMEEGRESTSGPHGRRHSDSTAMKRATFTEKRRRRRRRSRKKEEEKEERTHCEDVDRNPADPHPEAPLEPSFTTLTPPMKAAVEAFVRYRWEHLCHTEGYGCLPPPPSPPLSSSMQEKGEAEPSMMVLPSPLPPSSRTRTEATTLSGTHSHSLLTPKVSPASLPVHPAPEDPHPLSTAIDAELLQASLALIQCCPPSLAEAALVYVFTCMAKVLHISAVDGLDLHHEENALDQRNGGHHHERKPPHGLTEEEEEEEEEEGSNGEDSMEREEASGALGLLRDTFLRPCGTGEWPSRAVPPPSFPPTEMAREIVAPAPLPRTAADGPPPPPPTLRRRWWREALLPFLYLMPHLRWTSVVGLQRLSALLIALQHAHSKEAEEMQETGEQAVEGHGGSAAVGRSPATAAERAEKGDQTRWEIAPHHEKGGLLAMPYKNVYQLQSKAVWRRRRRTKNEEVETSAADGAFLSPENTWREIDGVAPEWEEVDEEEEDEEALEEEVFPTVAPGEEEEEEEDRREDPDPHHTEMGSTTPWRPSVAGRAPRQLRAPLPTRGSPPPPALDEQDTVAMLCRHLSRWMDTPSSPPLLPPSDAPPPTKPPWMEDEEHRRTVSTEASPSPVCLQTTIARLPVAWGATASSLFAMDASAHEKREGGGGRSGLSRLPPPSVHIVVRHAEAHLPFRILLTRHRGPRWPTAGRGKAPQADPRRTPLPPAPTAPSSTVAHSTPVVDDLLSHTTFSGIDSATAPLTGPSSLSLSISSSDRACTKAKSSKGVKRMEGMAVASSADQEAAATPHPQTNVQAPHASGSAGHPPFPPSRRTHPTPKGHGPSIAMAPTAAGLETPSKRIFKKKKEKKTDGPSPPVPSMKGEKPHDREAPKIGRGAHDTRHLTTTHCLPAPSEDGGVLPPLSISQPGELRCVSPETICDAVVVVVGSPASSGASASSPPPPSGSVVLAAEIEVEGSRVVDTRVGTEIRQALVVASVRVAAALQESIARFSQAEACGEEWLLGECAPSWQRCFSPPMAHTQGQGRDNGAVSAMSPRGRAVARFLSAVPGACAVQKEEVEDHSPAEETRPTNGVLPPTIDAHAAPKDATTLAPPAQGGAGPMTPSWWPALPQWQHYLRYGVSDTALQQAVRCPVALVPVVRAVLLLIAHMRGDPLQWGDHPLLSTTTTTTASAEAVWHSPHWKDVLRRVGNGVAALRASIKPASRHLSPTPRATTPTAVGRTEEEGVEKEEGVSPTVVRASPSSPLPSLPTDAAALAASEVTPTAAPPFFLGAPDGPPSSWRSFEDQKNSLLYGIEPPPASSSSLDAAASPNFLLFPPPSLTIAAAPIVLAEFLMTHVDPTGYATLPLPTLVRSVLQLFSRPNISIQRLSTALQSRQQFLQSTHLFLRLLLATVDSLMQEEGEKRMRFPLAMAGVRRIPEEESGVGRSTPCLSGLSPSPSLVGREGLSVADGTAMVGMDTAGYLAMVSKLFAVDFLGVSHGLGGDGDGGARLPHATPAGGPTRNRHMLLLSTACVGCRPATVHTLRQGMGRLMEHLFASLQYLLEVDRWNGTGAPPLVPSSSSSFGTKRHVGAGSPLLQRHGEETPLSSTPPPPPPPERVLLHAWPFGPFALCTLSLLPYVAACEDDLQHVALFLPRISQSLLAPFLGGGGPSSLLPLHPFATAKEEETINVPVGTTTTVGKGEGKTLCDTIAVEKRHHTDPLHISTPTPPSRHRILPDASSCSLQEMKERDGTSRSSSSSSSLFSSSSSSSSLTSLPSRTAAERPPKEVSTSDVGSDGLSTFTTGHPASVPPPSPPPPPSPMWNAFRRMELRNDPPTDPSPFPPLTLCGLTALSPFLFVAEMAPPPPSQWHLPPKGRGSQTVCGYGMHPLVHAGDPSSLFLPPSISVTRVQQWAQFRFGLVSAPPQMVGRGKEEKEVQCAWNAPGSQYVGDGSILWGSRSDGESPIPHVTLPPLQSQDTLTISFSFSSSAHEAEGGTRPWGPGRAARGAGEVCVHWRLNDIELAVLPVGHATSLWVAMAYTPPKPPAEATRFASVIPPSTQMKKSVPYPIFSPSPASTLSLPRGLPFSSSPSRAHRVSSLPSLSSCFFWCCLSSPLLYGSPRRRAWPVSHAAEREEVRRNGPDRHALSRGGLHSFVSFSSSPLESGVRPNPSARVDTTTAMRRPSAPLSSSSSFLFATSIVPPFVTLHRLQGFLMLFLQHAATSARHRRSRGNEKPVRRTSKHTAPKEGPRTSGASFSRSVSPISPVGMTSTPALVSFQLSPSASLTAPPRRSAARGEEEEEEEGERGRRTPKGAASSHMGRQDANTLSGFLHSSFPLHYLARLRVESWAWPTGSPNTEGSPPPPPTTTAMGLCATPPRRSPSHETPPSASSSVSCPLSLMQHRDRAAWEYVYNTAIAEYTTLLSTTLESPTATPTSSHAASMLHTLAALLTDDTSFVLLEEVQSILLSLLWPLLRRPQGWPAASPTLLQKMWARCRAMGFPDEVAPPPYPSGRDTRPPLPTGAMGNEEGKTVPHRASSPTHAVGVRPTRFVFGTAGLSSTLQLDPTGQTVKCTTTEKRREKYIPLQLAFATEGISLFPSSSRLGFGKDGKMRRGKANPPPPPAREATPTEVENVVEFSLQFEDSASDTNGMDWMGNQVGISLTAPPSCGVQLPMTAFPLSSTLSFPFLSSGMTLCRWPCPPTSLPAPVAEEKGGKERKWDEERLEGVGKEADACARRWCNALRTALGDDPLSGDGERTGVGEACAVPLHHSPPPPSAKEEEKARRTSEAKGVPTPTPPPGDLQKPAPLSFSLMGMRMMVDLSELQHFARLPHYLPFIVVDKDVLRSSLLEMDWSGREPLFVVPRPSYSGRHTGRASGPPARSGGTGEAGDGGGEGGGGGRGHGKKKSSAPPSSFQCNTLDAFEIPARCRTLLQYQPHWHSPSSGVVFRANDILTVRVHRLHRTVSFFRNGLLLGSVFTIPSHCTTVYPYVGIAAANTTVRWRYSPISECQLLSRGVLRAALSCKGAAAVLLPTLKHLIQAKACRSGTKAGLQLLGSDGDERCVRLHAAPSMGSRGASLARLTSHADAACLPLPTVPAFENGRVIRFDSPSSVVVERVGRRGGEYRKLFPLLLSPCYTSSAALEPGLSVPLLLPELLKSLFYVLRASPPRTSVLGATASALLGKDLWHFSDATSRSSSSSFAAALWTPGEETDASAIPSGATWTPGHPHSAGNEENADRAFIHLRHCPIVLRLLRLFADLPHVWVLDNATPSLRKLLPLLTQIVLCMPAAIGNAALGENFDMAFADVSGEPFVPEEVALLALFPPRASSLDAKPSFPSSCAAHDTAKKENEEENGRVWTAPKSNEENGGTSHATREGAPTGIAAASPACQRGFPLPSLLCPTCGTPWKDCHQAQHAPPLTPSHHLHLLLQQYGVSSPYRGVFGTWTGGPGDVWVELGPWHHATESFPLSDVSSSSSLQDRKALDGTWSIPTEELQGAGCCLHGRFQVFARLDSPFSFSGTMTFAVHVNVNAGKESEEAAAFYQEWACEACTFLNEGGTTRCSMCYTERRESVWTCGFCSNTSNPIITTTCSRCGRYRREQRGRAKAKEHLCYCGACKSITTYVDFSTFRRWKFCVSCERQTAWLPEVAYRGRVRGQLVSRGDVLRMTYTVDGKTYEMELPHSNLFSYDMLHKTFMEGRSEKIPTVEAVQNDTRRAPWRCEEQEKEKEDGTAVRLAEEAYHASAPPLFLWAERVARRDKTQAKDSSTLASKRFLDGESRSSDWDSFNAEDMRDLSSCASSSFSSSFATPSLDASYFTGGTTTLLYRRGGAKKASAAVASPSASSSVSPPPHSNMLLCVKDFAHLMVPKEGEHPSKMRGNTRNLLFAIFYFANFLLLEYAPTLMPELLTTPTLLTSLRVFNGSWLHFLTALGKNEAAGVLSTCLALLSSKKSYLLHQKTLFTLSSIAQELIRRFDELRPFQSHLLYYLTCFLTLQRTQATAVECILRLFESASWHPTTFLRSVAVIPALPPCALNARSLTAPVLSCVSSTKKRRQLAVFAALHGMCTTGEETLRDSSVVAMRTLIDVLRRMENAVHLPRLLEIPSAVNQALVYPISLTESVFSDSGELLKGQLRGSKGLVPAAGGKWYYEIVLPQTGLKSTNVVLCGWGTLQHEQERSQHHVGSDFYSWGYNCVDKIRLMKTEQVVPPSTRLPMGGDVIGALLDLETMMMTWSINGETLMWVSVPTQGEGEKLYPYVSAAITDGVQMHLTHTLYCPEGFHDFTPTNEELADFAKDSDTTTPQHYPFYEELSHFTEEANLQHFHLASSARSLLNSRHVQNLLQQYPLVRQLVMSLNDQKGCGPEAASKANGVAPHLGSPPPPPPPSLSCEGENVTGASVAGRCDRDVRAAPLQEPLGHPLDIAVLTPYIAQLNGLSDLTVMVAGKDDSIRDAPVFQHYYAQACRLLLQQGRWALFEITSDKRPAYLPTTEKVKINLWEAKKALQVHGAAPSLIPPGVVAPSSSHSHSTASSSSSSSSSTSSREDSSERNSSSSSSSSSSEDSSSSEEDQWESEEEEEPSPRFPEAPVLSGAVALLERVLPPHDHADRYAAVRSLFEHQLPHDEVLGMAAGSVESAAPTHRRTARREGSHSDAAGKEVHEASHWYRWMGAEERALVHSVTGQLFRQIELANIYSNAVMFTVRLTRHVTLDAGGVTRSIFSEVCNELNYRVVNNERVDPAVPLCTLCQHSSIFTILPNVQRFLVRHDATEKEASLFHRMLVWIGKLMGNMTLCGSLKLPLSFPRLVWKFLTFEEPTIEDYYYDIDDSIRHVLEDPEILLNTDLEELVQGELMSPPHIPSMAHGFSSHEEGGSGSVGSPFATALGSTSATSFPVEYGHSSSSVWSRAGSAGANPSHIKGRTSEGSRPYGADNPRWSGAALHSPNTAARRRHTFFASTREDPRASYVSSPQVSVGSLDEGWQANEDLHDGLLGCSTTDEDGAFGFYEQYKAKAEYALLHQYDSALLSLRSGLTSVVPQNSLETIRWYDLRGRICGTDSIRVDDILAFMDTTSLPAPVLENFKEVLKSMTETERGKFLIFCSGQNCLPLPENIRVTCGDDPKRAPIAHTCLPISLQLQPYADAQMMSDMLMMCLAHSNQYGLV